MSAKKTQVLYDWDTDQYGGITIHMNWGDLDNEIGEHREIYLQGDDATALEADLENCDSYELVEIVLSQYFDCIEEEES